MTSKFWCTQPVPQSPAELDRSQVGPLREADPSALSTECLGLPSGFEWCRLSLSPNQLTTLSEPSSPDPGLTLAEVRDFLSENYVSGDGFRFQYSEETLRWALERAEADSLLGVRSAQPNKSGQKRLLAFIAGIPATLTVHGSEVRMLVVDFLCIHPRFRSKGLCPVLIRELTNRAGLRGIYSAVYTSGTALPTPLVTVSYRHRFLNPRNLVDAGYCKVEQSVSRMMKRYRPAPNLHLPTAGLTVQPLTPADIPEVQELINTQNRTRKIAQVYSLEEIESLFRPRDQTVYSYVVRGSNETRGADEEKKSSGPVLGFFSFYSLPVLNSETQKRVQCAYLHTLASRPESPDEKSPISRKQLLEDCLRVAGREKFDVFTLLDLSDHAQFFVDLDFYQGSGSLNYYFYNYGCPLTAPAELDYVMI